MFDKAEKRLLIEAICDLQTNMIVEDSSQYESDKYRDLEALKVKIKNDKETEDE